MAKRRLWTEYELEFLRRCYIEHGAQYCASHLSRTPTSVYQAARKLNIAKENRYTDEELEYIRDNYASKGPTKLSKEMNRGNHAIRDMAVRLGLSVGKERLSERGKRNRAKWTDESCKSQSEKMTLRRGPLSPSWKGGICNVSQMVRGRLYSAWSKYVFQRDDYTCRLCGDKGGRVVAHHVRTFAQIRDAVKSEYPELSLDDYEDRETMADLVIEAHKLSDGITLCRSCHKKHHLENGVNCGNILTGGAEDNPQPSPPKLKAIVGGKVQRLEGEDSATDKPSTSAPLSVSHG